VFANSKALLTGKPITTTTTAANTTTTTTTTNNNNNNINGNNNNNHSIQLFMCLTTAIKANYSQAQNNRTRNILLNTKDIKIRGKFKKKKRNTVSTT
jgi:hypothetical protein